MSYLVSRLDGSTAYVDGQIWDESWLHGIIAKRLWIGTEYLNETLVREGYAVVVDDPHGSVDGFVRYPSPLLRERLEAAQAEAQTAEAGLWGACE